MTLYLSTAYLAPIQYYSKLLNADEIYVEAHENYIKQSYRTRCDIAAANGRLTLSIPVDRGSEAKCPIRDVRIDYAESWHRLHWRSIESAYRNSPFFEYFQDDLRPFYEKQYRFLFDFNLEIQEKIISLLCLENINIRQTDAYKTVFAEDEQDLRNIINPKKNAAAHDPDFISVSYYQVFEQKNAFLANLSIVDLLFNMGNEARLLLKQSVRHPAAAV